MKKQTKLFSLILALALVLSGCSLDALDTDSQISSAPPSTVETATPSPPPTAIPTPSPSPTATPTPTPIPTPEPVSIDLANIPAYAGVAYVEVNGNVPYFTEADYTTVSFERYSELNSLGRCGTAFACIGEDIMPTEERSEIGQVKPGGWQTVRYDGIVCAVYGHIRFAERGVYPC